MVPEEEPLDGEVLLAPDVPEEVSLPVPDELLPLVPGAPDVLLFGVSTVVVVVTDPEPPDALLPEDDAPDVEGSVVVVVVVVWAKVAVAVPISDRKMAIGNFFMLAPYWLSM